MTSEPSAGDEREPTPIHIYADESCLGNQFEDKANPGGAAGLIEQFRPGRGWRRRDYWAFEPDTTNNRMALRSALEGLAALEPGCDVVFTSDSQYLVKGMEEWIHSWARRGWRRKGGRIENLGMWKQLARAARDHRVQWRWVRGHAGHPKNEYVHHLATRAARERESSQGLVESGFDAWIQEKIDRGRFVDFLDLPPDEDFEPDDRPPAP